MTKKELVELIYANTTEYTKTYLNTTPKDGLEYLWEEVVFPKVEAEYYGCIKY